MRPLPVQVPLLVLLWAGSAPALGRPAAETGTHSNASSSAGSGSTLHASSVAARAVDRAHAERAAALLGLEQLTMLVPQHKMASQRVADQMRELKRHIVAAAQAEKGQQAALRQKHHDAQAADLFALAVYHYDEAAKLAETLMISNSELKKVEAELVSRLTAVALAANRALSIQKELGALLKDLEPSERAALKSSVDEIKSSLNAAKKASVDAQARAGLGTVESYAAQKSKRGAVDAKLQADLDKASADRARVFAAVHATRAPGCDLHQVDFKNRDYEGMSVNGRSMPIRGGQVPDAEMEVFGAPWVVSQVSFAHLSKDGAEQAVVGFSNQSADAPSGMSLVFDLGSACTVRYRGSVADFLRVCSGPHCYVSSPHRILPGGGATGCDASELGFANDKVVSWNLPKAPAGVCD